MCTSVPRGGVMTAGLGVMTAGVVAALLMRPRRDGILDVVHAWNEGHPDDPFTVQATVARRSGVSTW
jgi:hypothetical protein